LSQTTSFHKYVSITYRSFLCLTQLEGLVYFFRSIKPDHLCWHGKRMQVIYGFPRDSKATHSTCFELKL